ncbi:glycosyltransferase [Rhizobium sp. TRM96647]|uniref:glycosyltransferase n=1 Tax=unclassified Rhizobium TaxID=2613769 RepID=UPI0021E78923|nr:MULTISPECIES: glycosyltransferase [unclassified Rhizobium]MCV3736453.1 glycosyltransferase [Rhizobium sp. TRM96647]MCV3758822.1 glycosyltransferase [Rhizobium sp. TRM96650]
MTGKQQMQYDDRVPDVPKAPLPTREAVADTSALEEQVRSLLALNVSLRQRVEASERAMRSAAAAIDRQREQLAYRLGTEVIAATRSVSRLVGLPISLRRAYREYRTDLTRRQRNPDSDTTSSPAGVDSAQILCDTVEGLEQQIATLQRDNGLLLERADQADRAKNLSNDAIRQIQRQLAYRIGADIVAARSLPAMLKLPLTLQRTYADFKAGGTKHKRSDELHRDIGDLDAKMWGGFAKYARAELLQCMEDNRLAAKDRSAAAHALARWAFVDGDFGNAADLMERSIKLHRDNIREKRLCQLMCLAQAGRVAEAEAVLGHIQSKVNEFIDYSVMRADIARRRARLDGRPVPDSDRIYLDGLNRAMAPSGMSPIELADPARPLSIWNIVSHAPASMAAQTSKVSVIVPAFNAEKTLTMVLESLAAQTWRNIEIIVVDDCSTDGTCALVENFAAADPRVRLVRRTVNGGAYPARNDGVEVASGDFITVCDSDDWSHPEKIERQVNELAASPQCVAVLSHWLRVDDDLGVVGSWIPKKSLLDMNFSSLMMRRDVFDRLRGWDEVKVTGDAEFRARILAVYGEDSICKVKHNNILSFSLAREDSLTRSKATHMRSLYHGVRGQYRDSYRNWHLSLQQGGDPHLPRTNGRFPVPLGNRRAVDGDRTFDLVVICDFVLKGGAFVSTMNYIAAAARAGLKIAAVHWRKYELNVESPLNPVFYDACLKYGISILTPGDEVRTKSVLVGYPAVLQNMPDRFPKIETDNVIVLINQFATRLVDGSDRQYEPEVIRQHLVELFGTSGTWIPISHWVKRLMQEDPSYPEPYGDPWHPMVDTSVWCSTPIAWRGGGDRRPVLGRHGRDAYTKWPSTVEALKAAYCVDMDVDLKFQGGAKHARGMLGFSPQNWEVMHFDAIPVRAFLESLDFFIHFPHELYIEEFGRAPMEGMAAGKVTILPPQFRETFADAAVYCEPHQVRETVQRFWNDEAAYRAQAQKGREFVLRHCDQMGFIDRLNALTSTNQREHSIGAEVRAGS